MYVVNELLEDIFESSSLMPRIAPQPDPVMPTLGGKDASGLANSNGGDDDEEEELEEDIIRKHQKAVLENQSYLGEMRKDNLLDGLRMDIIDRTRVIMEECVAYKENFEQYSYLWTENRQEYMKQFLEVKENEDGEVIESENQPIQLEKFESEIRKFEGIHKTVMAVDPDVHFQNWFKVDSRPIKQSLNLVVKKWSYTLTKHLSDDVVGSLNDLNKFIKFSKTGLQAKIEEGDYDGLVASMGLLHSIKHRSANTDMLFEPLRKTINLLKQFGVDMPDEIHKLLNDLPEEWAETKKLSVSIKDYVAPLQAKEVDVLQQKCMNSFIML